MYEDLNMNQAFSQILFDMMKEDERIVVMEADLGGAHKTWNIREAYPERYFDCGIAEQAMVSVAGGLSAYGFIPVASTFTPFMARRACDQITISCLYAQQNVKLFGSDPGVTAETNGGTHMSMEDIGVMRSIPNIIITEPADNTMFAKLMPQIINHNGTIYTRMCRKSAVKPIFGDDEEFDLFKAYKMRDGKDVSIFATGIMVEDAKAAAEELAKEGIEVDLIEVHTIKPLDTETLAASARKTGCVVTCENSNVVGGFYAAVLEALNGADCRVPVTPIGVQDHFGEVGFLPGLKEKYHMTTADIIAAVKETIKKK